MDSVISRRDLLRAAAISGVLGAAVVLAGCGGDKPSQNATEGSPLTSAHAEFMPEAAWAQDFSHMPNGPVDPKVWKFDLDPNIPGYNNELQGYTNSQRNVRIENGLLVIEAHREAYSYPGDSQNRKFDYTSGRITTLGSLEIEYGKVEVTMKLPKGSGTWPAFWFLSAQSPFSSKLPQPTDDAGWETFYTHDGELDVVEAFGNRPGVIESTVHTFNAGAPDKDITVADASDTFHTYGLDITPTQLIWTIDSRPYFIYNKPSDKTDDWPIGKGNKFYAILNLAMGGLGGPVDPKANSWRLEVKDIKYTPLAAHQ